MTPQARSVEYSARTWAVTHLPVSPSITYSEALPMYLHNSPTVVRIGSAHLFNAYNSPIVVRVHVHCVQLFDDGGIVRDGSVEIPALGVAVTPVQM